MTLFLLGVGSFLLLFLLRNSGRLFIVLGGVSWISAYFWVLAANYRRRAPLWTRGGLLRYEKRPRTYKLLYGFMALLAGFVLLVFLALNISRR